MKGHETGLSGIALAVFMIFIITWAIIIIYKNSLPKKVSDCHGADVKKITKGVPVEYWQCQECKMECELIKI
jgi:hypothetical protein